jgi:hypothetical protein
MEDGEGDGLNLAWRSQRNKMDLPWPRVFMVKDTGNRPKWGRDASEKTVDLR